VPAFNRIWVEAVVSNAVAAGAFLAIPIAWLLTRDAPGRLAGILLGTMGLVVAGAIVWGARMAEFDTFHAFFAGIVVFAIPVAAAAVWILWRHLRDTGFAQLAVVLLILFVAQIELGVLPAITRLHTFGAGTYEPIPLDVLAAIRALPTEAKLAYACKTDEEFAFWTPGLISIYAHTGRRVVPMCFEVDNSSVAVGADPSIRVENPFFAFVPQHALFMDEATRPPSDAVSAFLKDHRIDYIYADAEHPNSLVPEALPIASIQGVEVLKIP
jgi:hypothetical protein